MRAACGDACGGACGGAWRGAVRRSAVVVQRGGRGEVRHGHAVHHATGGRCHCDTLRVLTTLKLKQRSMLQRLFDCFNPERRKGVKGSYGCLFLM